MRKHSGFTLIELLVVVAIIAILVAILLPSLGKARDRAKATTCAANLKGIGTGLVVYHTDNDGYVVPSYNMNSYAGGPTDPLDGWAPILDRDEVIRGKQQASAGNIFYCPSTVDVEGMAGGQTGTDPDKARGWMDWPSIRVSNAVNTPTTIPSRGLNKIIRVSYWINADNPIGSQTTFVPDSFYTSSVGYGPSTDGRYMRATKWTVYARPQALIALADGVYAGRQRDGRLNGTDGVTNSRVGYRHTGGQYANVAFADGHVESVRYSQFPRSAGGLATTSMVREENAGPYTVYADPERSVP